MEGMRNALLELSTGAEGTAKNHAEFSRLERLWVSSQAAGVEGLQVTDIVLPRHSEEAFIAFLRWLVTEGDRARSFHIVLRSAAGVMMAELQITNWTKTARVKAVVKELGSSHGVAATPDSHATRRILGFMYELLQKMKPELRHRTLVMADLELMAGVRVSES